MEHPITNVDKKKPKRSRRQKLLRLLVACVVLLLLAEIGLRFLGLGNPVLTIADKDCEYLFAPNQQSTRFFSNNHINQYSMRSDDITAEKPAGTYRILMIGDSVLYGTTYIDQSRIFSSQIQRDLPANLHESVQVLNASAGGWATGNELGYLTSRGAFHSDVVVFVLNTGDFDFVTNVVDVQKEYITQKPFCALTELWTHYLSPRIFGRAASADSGSMAVGDGKIVRERIDGVLANIKAARDFSNEHGAGFAILFSPALGGSWENEGYQFGYGRLLDFTKANLIPVVDMTPVYKAVPLESIYQAGNIHLKAEGDDLVAKTFVEALPQVQAGVVEQLRAHLASAPASQQK